MKTKRRHELQTNILADWMGKQIEVLRPHSQAIAIGAIAVVAIIAGAIALSQWLGSREPGGWPEYFGAFAERDPEKLQEVAETEGVDDRAANWALLTAAELQMSEGAQQLYEDKDEGADILEQARDKLAALAKRSPSDPYLKQRSQYVAGQVYESLAAARTTGVTKNLDKAREHYNKAKEVAPDTPLGKAAAEALERLKDEKSVVALLQEFAKHKPPERSGAAGLPPLGAGGVSAENPPLTERDLPERPDLSLPGFGLDLDDDKKPAGDSTPGTESDEPPGGAADGAPDAGAEEEGAATPDAAAGDGEPAPQ
jgi:hypothetical protein